MLDSKPLLFPGDFPPIKRRSIDTLQVNLGLTCNQSCIHCHVDAGPGRRETMSSEVINDVKTFLDRHKPATLDLTGGAPELHQGFQQLVPYARERGIHVLDRCNLTILTEPGQQSLAQFLADNQVEVIASLPCYLEENVDGQRGKGVFEQSLAGLKRLNELGYGKPDSGLVLNLVYNPTGAFLPPSQQVLTADYQQHLGEKYGVVFNALFTITNMPIKRFGSFLQSKGEFAQYMQLLKDAYTPSNLETVMCRDLISIDWQGYVYDCDFNQMLDMKVHKSGQAVHLRELNNTGLENHPILTADHCYGCTAGQGSSCGGALTDAS